MNKSYIKYIVIFAVGILFLYSVFAALSQKPSAPSQPPFPTLNLPVKEGTLTVKDFTKTPAAKIGDTISLAQNNNFIISYYTKDQSFLITILSLPLEQNRNAAEQDLLDLLQIKQADACALTVSLTVPAAVDEKLAGQDYGLSFCPLGRLFPSN